MYSLWTFQILAGPSKARDGARDGPEMGSGRAGLPGPHVTLHSIPAALRETLPLFSSGFLCISKLREGFSVSVNFNLVTKT